MEDINVTSYTADVVKKKKRPGIVIGVAAAVLVGGSGVAYAAVPVVHNTVNMTVMSPEKYCASVYENSIDKCLKDFEPKIQEAEKINGGSFKLTVEPDSNTMSMIESQIGQDIFDKLSVSIDGSRNDASVSGAVSLSADDKEVVSANILGFSESGKIYAQVPGLSDKYLYADCKDMFGEELDETYKNSMKKTDPTIYNDYKDLFNKYSKKFIKIIDKGTSELDKGVEGKVADVNYKYNQVTTVLKADDINPFIQELSNEIKNDEKLKGLCEKIYGKTLLDKIYNESGDKDNDDSCKVENDVTVKTLIDQEGTIRGIDFSQDEDQIGFIAAKEDENVGFELISSGKTVISVKAVEKDDSYTGKLTVSSKEDDDFVIDFENIKFVDDKHIDGSVSMDLSKITDNKFKTLALSFKAVDNGQNISTDISGIGKFSVDILTSKDSKEDAQEPKDAVNVKDINEYLDGADVKAYLDEASKKLGFTYEQLETLVQGIQSMLGINNHSDEYNDDDFSFDNDNNFDDIDSGTVSNDNSFDDEDSSYGYVEIKQPFEDIKFVINGKEAKLPVVTAEMMPEGTSDKKIAGGDFDSISNEDATFSMSFQNPSSDEQPAYQCELFSVSSTDENVNFSINTIKVGSTLTDLQMRFPDAKINDDTTSVLISDSTTQSGTIGFSIDDGVVTGITCYFM